MNRIKFLPRRPQIALGFVASIVVCFCGLHAIGLLTPSEEDGTATVVVQAVDAVDRGGVETLAVETVRPAARATRPSATPTFANSLVRESGY